jgi:hypothetical protein
VEEEEEAGRLSEKNDAILFTAVVTRNAAKVYGVVLELQGALSFGAEAFNRFFRKTRWI